MTTLSPLWVTLVPLILLASASPGLAWSNGHDWIRQWAVQRLPSWQADYFGDAALHAIQHDYTHLQDHHASGRRPDLDPYCKPAELPELHKLSLHDTNSDMAATYTGMHWYLEQVSREMAVGRADEAMKYLGVLCHWLEDPASPSMHSSPVNEMTMRELLPPPPRMQNYNYLYGAGWIDLEGNDLAKAGRVMIPAEPYQPRLLGSTTAEAAARIANEQREIRRRAAGRIIPLIQARLADDTETLAARVGEALLDSAQLTADVIYTAGCLASGRELTSPQPQPLTAWTPQRPGGLAPHPYYAVHYLLNQAMDADRNLHPLRLGGEDVAFGFGAGAPVSLRFSLAGGGVWRTLQTRVGLHPSAGPQGAVLFKILIDGSEAAASGIIKSGDAAVLLSAELPDKPAIELTLQTLAADGSNNLHNLVVWAEPLLLPAR